MLINKHKWAFSGLFSSALLFAAPGLTVLLASAFDVYMLLIAKKAITDGAVLSEAFIHKAKLSQWITGATLTATGVFIPYIFRIGEFTARFLSRISWRSFLGLLGVAVFSLTLFIQFALFDNLPHVTDAISHLFQAKIVASGHVFASPPPCPNAFFQHHVVMTADGKWFGKFTPGHALLLAGAIRLGISSLIVPLCSALLGVWLAILAEKFYPRTTAQAAGLLFCLSPFILLLGASYMSHTPFVLFLLVALHLLLRSRDHDIAGRQKAFRSSLAAAGFFFGWASITRMHEAALMGMFYMAVMLLGRKWPWKFHLKAAPFFLAGALVPIGFMIWWDHVLYGQWLVSGYALHGPNILSPMYQDAYGFSSKFGPGDALRITGWTVRNFNHALLGCPIALPLIAAALFHPKRTDAVCLAACILIVAFYFFYPYYGLEFEARYYYLASPFAIVLAVRGLEKLNRLFSRFPAFRPPDSAGGRGVSPVLGGLLAFSILQACCYYWPVRLWPVYGNRYEGCGPELHRHAVNAGLHNAVVLVDAPDQPFLYSSGFIYNDPHLKNDVLYAHWLPDNQCMLKSFSERTIYRYTRTAATGDENLEPMRAPLAAAADHP